MSLAVALAGFACCAAVIFVAGRQLGRYGQIIADVTGLGGAWIGLILLATVTSLPELMVGLSSSALVGSADLAVGDVLGSCAFNLFILAALDAVVPRRRPLFGTASGAHVLAAALQIVGLVLVALSILYPAGFRLTPWIGLSSVLLAGGYFLAVRLLYHQAQRGRGNQDPLPAFAGGEEALGGRTLRQVGLRFAAFAVVIVAAATALPPFARGIAAAAGLTESFVGTFFLAASTSLPELAVSFAAVRRGSVDLAVGNLLGSNLFNLLILAVDDLAYQGGPLLQDASGVHLVSVLATILMSAIVIIGLSYQMPGKRLFLAWDAALILLVYAANLGFQLAL